MKGWKKICVNGGGEGYMWKHAQEQSDARIMKQDDGRKTFLPIQIP